ncbi:MAG TPA: hypothetical protein VLQ79_14125 [Myxococcaceae bacterium]|nr:hypothetical protein [Myxococcaceae bacterium]
MFHASQPRLGAGLQASDFGEFTRADGVTQSTYRGWPLYRYAGDVRAGDTSGDNFEAWYVVKNPFADPAGRTLYVRTNDVTGAPGLSPASACTSSGCLANWPVFLASGSLDSHRCGPGSPHHLHPCGRNAAVRLRRTPAVSVRR